MQQPNAIPKETAFQICKETLEQYPGKWYTATGLQCWGCLTLSKGDPTRMCVSSRLDYCGCNLVNAHYDKQMKQR